MNTTESIVTIIVALGAIAGGAFYLFGTLRKQNDEASHESNEILRNLIDDQKQELLRLRERQHDTVNEIQVLKLQVQHIQDKREYLEKLVMVALQQYFSTDPTIAQAVKVSISNNESGLSVDASSGEKPKK